MSRDDQQTSPSTVSPAERGEGPFGARAESEADRVRQARRLAGRDGGIPALNRLAELAAQILGTASAQVSIIAEDQVVMGGTGAATESVGARSAAADSLCTVTVAEGSPVVVPDAPADPRVSLLPPVRAGVVGAYLGVPLVSNGHRIGALCVFDPAPRTWSEEDVSVLELLVSPVLAELELAALEDTYEQDRMVWQLAVDAAGVGAFDWDLRTGELRWDERLLELFGSDREAFGGTIEAFNDLVHPDDREQVTRALTAAIDGCSGYAAEYRIVRPDGDVRWISARGHALAGPDGLAARVLGAAFDTTAVRDGEARVARVLEAMPSAFFHLDRDWRFTYANGEAERLLSGIGAGVVGEVIWELFPDAVGTEFEENYRRAVSTGEPVSFEAYYPVPLDAWYEIRAWPTPDGLSVYFLEITARRRAEAAVERATGRTALLAEVTRALTETLDGDEAVARLARLVVPGLGDWCVVTVVDGHGPVAGNSWRHRLRDVGWAHADPAMHPVLERYAEVRVPALTDLSFVARALQQEAPVVVPEGAAESIAQILATGEARDLCRQLDPSSAVVVPLRGRGRVAGLLSIFRDATREPFSPDDLRTLADLADRAGLALDNAQLYAGQRELAEGLQRSMLTAPPEPDHLHLVARYTPAAEAAQVGGDWYDGFVQPSGATMVVIGDVVGHDTEAAAAMGQVRGLLRGIAVTTEDPPAVLLSRVDAAIRALQVETTATVVAARLEQTDEERARGLTRVRWSNAGHPPPVVVVPREAADLVRELNPGTELAAVLGTGPGQGDHATVHVLWAAEHNLLLGLNPAAKRTETVLTLPREALFLLYTDGLIERRGQSLDTGLDALVSALVDLADPGLPLEAMCDELLERLLPERPDDDVALLAVRLYREDRPRPAEAGPESIPGGL